MTADDAVHQRALEEQEQQPYWENERINRSGPRPGSRDVRKEYEHLATKTNMRRLYSAVNPATRPLSSSVPAPRRTMQSASSPTRPRTAAAQQLTHRDILKESVQGQPLEVRELLDPPSKHTGPALLRGLRQQVLNVTRERDTLAAELDKLKKSSRATRMAELEAEVQIYREQLAHQADVQQACMHSVASAEARARDAEYKARAAVDALQTYLRTGDVTAPLPRQALSSSSLSGRRKTRTLSALRSAHDIIIGQATQLRRAFNGLHLDSVDRLAKVAASNPDISGSPDVLRYLLVHLTGLATELRNMPGGSDALQSPSLYKMPTASTANDSSAQQQQGGNNRNGRRGEDQRYLYPMPGPLPRQISNTGELVLSLMDTLHDLRHLPSTPAYPLHPMFLHEMETIASLSKGYERELARLGVTLQARHDGGDYGRRPQSAAARSQSASVAGLPVAEGQEGGEGEEEREEQEEQEDRLYFEDSHDEPAWAAPVGEEMAEEVEVEV